VKTDDLVWYTVVISPSSVGERLMGHDRVDAVIRRCMIVEVRGIMILKRK
jgi:hypothetical protein